MSSLSHRARIGQAENSIGRTLRMAAVVYAVLALAGIARGEETKPQRTQRTQSQSGHEPRATGNPLDRIPPADRAILDRVADAYGLQGDARRLLYAIRIAENGGPGREMGVLAPAAMRYAGDHARSLELQARWAAGTIRRRYTGDLPAFAARWAPAGAANDPEDMNRNWLPNIRRLMVDQTTVTRRSHGIENHTGYSDPTPADAARSED